ncbi:hypothetical protein RJ640_006830 [Escallonia rubra]|uniref:Tf2-1-like SH3-like domain-containing protein n=1 Tax=Escallonia rubra TaxID=112253 RepID=A0AA88QN27_9ASTE|nr:hypothetical protein RJ640_006830 [Escallonia rubra]
MTEEDLLFNFIDGLQNWAKQELQRRGVKDIDEAIAVAESLMEYARVGDSSKGKNVQVASKGNHAKGGGDKPKAWHKGNNQVGTNKFEGHGKLEERRAKSKPKDGCFFCGGPHWARDFPRQGKMAALIEEKEKAECETVHIGSIQVLNALQKKNVPQVLTGKGQASKSEGLLYMEAKLNGKLAHVLMDTGATHNFITMGEAERLGLNVVDGGGWLKTVNAEAKPLQGTIRRVEMCLGKWKGFVNFSVARMDDFKVVLGLDFLRQVNALVSPYNNAVCIMERGAACVVPLFGGTSSTMTSMRLSGMRLAQEVEREEAKKNEGTYLSSLKVEDRVVLHEFEKRQPPRRKVDREAVSKTKGNHTVQEKRNVKTCLGDKQDKAKRRLKRRPREYKLGDLVMVRTLRKVHKGFVSRYEGPFPITAKIGKASYQVQLPPKPKVHAVFHVSLLRSHIARMEDHDHGKSRRTPTVKVKFYDKKTENVLSGEAQVKARSCTNKALLGQVEDRVVLHEFEKRQPPRRKVDREAVSKTKGNHTVQEKRNVKTCLGDKQDKAKRRLKRRPREYKLGDLVMVRTLRKVHKGFVSRYEGPFPITAKIGKASYQVQLPPKPKVHAVFHVSLLRSHIARMEDHDHGKSRRTPTVKVKFYDKKTENVLSGEAQVKARSCTNKALLDQFQNNESMPFTENTLMLFDTIFQHVQNWSMQNSEIAE